MNPRSFQQLSALTVGLALLLISQSALAHPGALWGIDLSSVVALRDQARMAAYQSADAPGERLNRVQTIVLDPGHGGDNNGAIGVAGIREKHLTLELAYHLREAIQARYPDVRVVMTRYWDTSLSLPERVHLANLAEADVFLSLHYNAAVHNRAVGYETFYLRPADVTPQPPEILGHSHGEDASPIEGAGLVGQHGDDLVFIQRDLIRANQHELSARLAHSVQDGFRGHLDSIDRGVKQANFGVLRGAHMPAVVVEAGFLTHPEEGSDVIERAHRQRVVNALLDAIVNFDAELEQVLDDQP
ncbi:N-acetylmuramoyl-L-alanine amidase [Lujinxingia vulgaris]|uniref:N-acetylmuramoyl-L-alanine amidase n=1 Tax=Lujinxingia vulgaris TaxID=2600176 RepID=A0A5C6WWC5_9DELT|nr:N-acetylmuramoyl-L-alanine amidase [Lujinxingia vulgaris]TXD33612.1 N-acetylmuramoyl-L-alanine amidase [Lujinxingia vulgaris]